MAAGKKKRNYDCASCKGDMHRCLLHNQSVELQVPEMPGRILTVDKQNYSKIFPVWFEAVGHSFTPEWLIFSHFDLCPIPIFTPFSITAIQLYNATGGMGKFISPSHFLSQPAIYIDAIETISASVSECSEFLMEQSRRENGIKQS